MHCHKQQARATATNFVGIAWLTGNQSSTFTETCGREPNHVLLRYHDSGRVSDLRSSTAVQRGWPSTLQHDTAGQYLHIATHTLPVVLRLTCWTTAATAIAERRQAADRMRPPRPPAPWTVTPFPAPQPPTCGGQRPRTLHTCSKIDYVIAATIDVTLVRRAIFRGGGALFQREPSLWIRTAVAYLPSFCLPPSEAKSESAVLLRVFC